MQKSGNHFEVMNCNEGGLQQIVEQDARAEEGSDRGNDAQAD